MFMATEHEQLCGGKSEKLSFVEHLLLHRTKSKAKIEIFE